MKSTLDRSQDFVGQRVLDPHGIVSSDSETENRSGDDCKVKIRLGLPSRYYRSSNLILNLAY